MFVLFLLNAVLTLIVSDSSYSYVLNKTFQNDNIPYTFLHSWSKSLFQDYDQFDMANEVDELEKFLKVAPDDATVTSNAEIHLGNGEVTEQNSKSIEDAQNGDASEAVVGSTTNEDQFDQQPVVENGTHESNDIGVSEDGVDSSNAEAE